MLSLRPGEVVDDIMHRHDGARGGGLSIQVVQSTEIHIVLALQANIVQPLSNVAVAKIVDQVTSKKSGIANCDTLVVTEIGQVRFIAWELGSVGHQSRNPVILQVASYEKAMARVSGQVVIEFENVGGEI